MGGGVKFKCQDVAEILAKDGNFWFCYKKGIFLVTH
jgi:hypothetical protein